jgi:hypothetical protein
LWFLFFSNPCSFSYLYLILKLYFPRISIPFFDAVSIERKLLEKKRSILVSHISRKKNIDFSVSRFTLKKKVK